MGKYKRGFMLYNFREQAIKRAKRMIGELDALPLVSLIKCQGSQTRLGCNKPLYTNVKMKKLRDMWIYKLENEGNEQNKLLGVELRPLCFVCILDHPEVKPFLGKTEKRVLQAAKKLGA